MHCHLRQPVPPVVFGFNHEAGFATHNAPAYQLSPKLGNPPLSYRHLTGSNFGAVRHSGFYRKWISIIPLPPRAYTMHPATRFQHNQTMHGRVIAIYLFSSAHFSGDPHPAVLAKLSGFNHTKFEMVTGQSSAINRFV